MTLATPLVLGCRCQASGGRNASRPLLHRWPTGTRSDAAVCRVTAIVRRNPGASSWFAVLPPRWTPARVLDLNSDRPQHLAFQRFGADEGRP